jgi:hypothetical protein
VFFLRPTTFLGGQMKSLRHLKLISLLGALVAASSIAATGATAASAATCSWSSLSQAFAPWGDSNSYFLAPGGDFQDTSGWTMAGGAGLAQTGAGYDSGDTNSLALPTTTSAATTPTICVTSDSPSFRMLIKNNGNLGYSNGQLAVYLNFSGADGKPQQVKIAALTVKNTAWTLTPAISFIQYLSTPLRSGYANISFTIKPNDNHGNWQIDDLYVDPCHSR